MWPLFLQDNGFFKRHIDLSSKFPIGVVSFRGCNNRSQRDTLGNENRAADVFYLAAEMPPLLVQLNISRKTFDTISVWDGYYDLVNIMTSIPDDKRINPFASLSAHAFRYRVDRQNQPIT